MLNLNWPKVSVSQLCLMWHRPVAIISLRDSHYTHYELRNYLPKVKNKTVREILNRKLPTVLKCKVSLRKWNVAYWSINLECILMYCHSSESKVLLPQPHAHIQSILSAEEINANWEIIIITSFRKKEFHKHFNFEILSCLIDIRKRTLQSHHSFIYRLLYLHISFPLSRVWCSWVSLFMVYVKEKIWFTYGTLQNLYRVRTVVVIFFFTGRRNILGNRCLITIMYIQRLESWKSVLYKCVWCQLLSYYLVLRTKTLIYMTRYPILTYICWLGY